MRLYQRYDVVRTIQQGVHLVRDLLVSTSAEIVLKEVGTDSEHTREELAREFRTLVGLRHPAIVRTLDFGGDAAGARYLTTELVEGEPLDRVLPGARPEQVLALFAKTADALAWAHGHGVLHGDIKPANVLARLEPSLGLVLIDFGLARLVVGDAAPAGGTPAFVAPELLLGSPASIASDLYGLGAAFFAGLTGTPPTPGMRVSGDARIPQKLGRVLDALLAADPAARPLDAEAVLRRLGATPTAGAADPPFVDRRVDLDLLTRRSAGVLLVRGPEGIGKSRLLREARWRLQLDGRLVVESCSERSDARPFGPFPDAARMLAELALAVDSRQSMVDSRRSTGGSRQSTAASQEVVERTVSDLRAATALQPVVLLDDADRGEPRALDLLAGVAAACARDRLCALIIACAPGAFAERLATAASGIDVLDLGPLDAAAVGSLVTAVLGRSDESFAAALSERSGGVPLFAVDLLRCVGPRTEPGELDPSCLRLSPEAAAVVRRRLETLPAIAREAATTLAALDRPSSADELSALVDGLDATGVEQLCVEGIVQQRAGELCLVGAGLAAALLGPETRTLHVRLAERLERRGAAAAEVDRHKAAAGDVEAALRTAQRLLEGGAGREAFDVVDPFRQAIAKRAAAQPERALDWVDVALRAGEHAATREMAERLVEHRDGAVRARALLALGEALERLGDLAGARARLDAALGSLEKSSDKAAARLRLSRVTGLAGDHRAAVEHARAGLAARGGQEAGLRVQLGIALLRLGSVDDARTELEAARGAAEKVGDRRLVAAALGNLAILHSSRGETEAARDLFAAALAEAEAAGDTAALPVHLLNLATAHEALRDPGTAIDLLRRAETLARRLERTGPLGNALINLANLYAQIGAEAEARETAGAAAELAARTGVKVIAAQAALVQAEIEMTSDPAAAQRRAVEAREAFAFLGDAARAAEAGVVEGEIAVARGDLEVARAAARDARPAAAPGVLARLELLEAGIRRAEGAAGAAMDFLDRALAAAEHGAAMDLAARIDATAADLLDEVGSPLGEVRRRRAAERLTATALRLPPALREAFWRVPWRARVRVEGESRAAAVGGRRSAVGEGALRLLALAPRIMAERDAQRVLELALDAGLDVVGGERGFLLLREGDDWQVVAARNIDHETIRRPSFKFSRSVAEQVAQTGEPVLTASAMDDPRFAAARSVHQLALQSIVCVPIRSRERVLGTIYIENRFSQGRFSEEHLRLAQALADQVALALESGRLERALRERAEELERARGELARRVEVQEDELARLEREVRRTREETTLRHEYGEIIGRGAAMRRLLETLDRVSDTSLPVLIEGATGTGKELVARALHTNGPRRGRPFVTVNCGALPDLLLESELFGHARGAFTGADRARTGLMREASGGTLFLDEVGEMSAAMQVKLLRAIQNAEVTPLGTDRPVAIDVRVVAATNRRLAELVREGRFREDLFYRLNVIHVEVPSLAERREDVPDLAEHFLQRIAAQTGKAPKKLTRAALGALLRHDFPGNVRELENLLSQAAVFAPEEGIRPEDLPLALTRSLPPTTGGSRRDYLRAADRRLVEQTMTACGGNISQVARRLGISRPTLYRRLGEYELGRKSAVDSRQSKGRSRSAKP